MARPPAGGRQCRIVAAPGKAAVVQQRGELDRSCVVLFLKKEQRFFLKKEAKIFVH